MRGNKKLPTIEDLIGGQSPNYSDVIDEFGTLDSLINSSGPLQRLGNKPNTFQDLKAGFERFKEENGHYPTTMEVDQCEYFPRVRSLERSWGGVTNLRKFFGLKVADYSSGSSRSITARRVNRKAFELEREMEKRLISLFGEELVHVEKPWSQKDKKRLDFFVYTANGAFGVDVFNPSTLFNLKVQVLLKMKQYNGARFPLFLVFANPLLDDREVQACLARKKTPLPPNVKVMSWDNFLNEIASKFVRYSLR